MKHALSYTLLVLCSLLFATEKAQAFNLDSVFNKEKHAIKLDLRIDFDGSINNQEKNSAAFKATTFRVVLEGDFSPKLGYLIRQRLNKSGSVSKDNFLAATDYAMLIYRPNQHWRIEAGKQIVQLGTFEYNYNTSTLYFFSQPNNLIQAYETGIRAAYTVANQEFNLQITDARAPQFAAPDYDYAFNYAAMWAGSFFNGTFNTRYGYMISNVDKDKTTQWITIGNQLILGSSTLELEYMNGAYYQPATWNENTLFMANDQTAIASYKLFFGKNNRWAFGVKGMWDKRRDKDLSRTVYNKYTASTLLEYYPLGGDKLNVHLAYAFCRTNYNKAITGYNPNNQNRILTGFRWFFSII